MSNNLPKPRKRFTSDQISILEQFYFNHQGLCPKGEDLSTLCTASDLSRKQIQGWFARARKREKNKLSDDEDKTDLHPPSPIFIPHYTDDDNDNTTIRDPEILKKLAEISSSSTIYGRNEQQPQQQFLPSSHSPNFPNNDNPMYITGNPIYQNHRDNNPHCPNIYYNQLIPMEKEISGNFQETFPASSTSSSSSSSSQHFFQSLPNNTASSSSSSSSCISASTACFLASLSYENLNEYNSFVNIPKTESFNTKIGHSLNDYYLNKTFDEYNYHDEEEFYSSSSNNTTNNIEFLNIDTNSIYSIPSTSTSTSFNSEYDNNIPMTGGTNHSSPFSNPELWDYVHNNDEEENDDEEEEQNDERNDDIFMMENINANNGSNNECNNNEEEAEEINESLISSWINSPTRSSSSSPEPIFNSNDTMAF